MEWLLLLGGLFVGIAIGYLLWHQHGSSGPLQNEVRFMFIVADDNPDVSYSVSIGEVKDAEGNVIADPQGISVEVESSDESVVAVTEAEDGKSGTVSFGSPGQATLTANVKDVNGELLATGAASFTVTTGNPASVSGVGLAFAGLTEV